MKCKQSADFGNVKNQLTLKCKKPVDFWKCKQPVTIPLRFPKNSQRIPKEFPNLCTANYEVINKFELAIQGS